VVPDFKQGIGIGGVELREADLADGEADPAAGAVP
jgi:hypothetical protein